MTNNNKPTANRTGTAKTCKGCIHLENNEDITNLCYEFPAMDNMVRCIQYEACKPINTIQTNISKGDKMRIKVLNQIIDDIRSNKITPTGRNTSTRLKNLDTLADELKFAVKEITSSYKQW